MNSTTLTFLAESPYLRSLPYGSKLTQYPLCGRRRSWILNRKKIYFSFDENFKAPPIRVIHLSPMLNESGEFLLEHINSKALNDEEGFFKLKALGDTPFRHNQNWVKESFLMKGDFFEMGAHRFVCEEAQSFDEENWLDEVRPLLKTEMNILLQGETGTGKSRLAREIHEYSRATRPFIHINMASFTPTLLESEIFGHVKGAFTGALHDKLGAIREAQDGTLFLDEIDSLPLSVQTKLLLFLDSKKIRPVGGKGDIPCRTRIIFASGSDIKQMVEQGKFRKDFYFRLNSGLFHHLKSLREDPRLLERFCRQYSEKYFLHIPSDLLSFYKELPWPGNYRQLEGHLNLKRHLYENSPWKFDAYDLKLEGGHQVSDIWSYDRMSLKDLKHNYIKKIYNEVGRDLRLATKILKVAPQTVKDYVAR